MECANRNLEAGMFFKSNYPKYIGIDVAKSPAQTVATVVANINGDRVVLDWLPLGGEDFTVQANIIAAWIAQMRNVRGGLVDTTSQDGDAIHELLAKAVIGVKIDPIKFKE